MTDWKYEYFKLRKAAEGIYAYCDTCIHDSNESSNCDFCSRKSIGWELDVEALPPAPEEYLKILELRADFGIL